MKKHPWYDPDVCDPEDYPSGTPKQPKWWPGLVAVLVLGFIVLLLAFSVSCAQTTLYRDGKKIFQGQGDMTGMRYVHHADGSCELTSETIDHSSATLAQGKAAEGKIAAAGTGLAASGLTYLLSP